MILDRSAFTAAAIYLLFGGLWISLSDRLLAAMVSDPALLTTYQTYKGWAFVTVMAALAYGLIGRLSRQVTALRESEAQLEESEWRFREMADNIDQIFYLAAADYSRFFYVSPAYAHIWGRSVESLLAAPESWLEGVAAEDRERIAQVIANGRDSGFYEAVFRVVRTDGTLRWVHSRAYELRDTAGRAYRVTGIIDDVTARRQGEEEIHALARTLESRVAERTAALELANRELEAFSYSVSHDLRAPLRAMSGYAHLLADDTDSRFGPDGRKMLERIRANAEHMGELIEDILEFSRVGRNELRHDRIDMTALAQGVADEMHDDYPQAKFEIGALPVAHGDPAMLRQVWINLICNALKFSSKRAEPRIEIGGETAADGTATWFVRDNGAGFDMTYAARLFGVFQRLHRADDYPGTGAGLAIVKRIVTRHGGRIEAESVLDGGATFRFSLPGAN